jgi:hypothetical protein
MLIFVLCVLSIAQGANLANPAMTIRAARTSLGLSYHLGGYTLTNKAVPSLFNRIAGRFAFAPIEYVTIGIDGGATKVDVASYSDSSIAVGTFQGKFGFSAGGQLKGRSPLLFNEMVGVLGIVNATYFSSTNDNNVKYKGYDGSGVIALVVRIPTFGYIAAGPMVYLIEGTNQSYDGKERPYSNINNIRGWVGVDYILPTKEALSRESYLSFELSISPDVTINGAAPIQEISFSISVGWISNRLYGEELENGE